MEKNFKLTQKFFFINQNYVYVYIMYYLSNT